MKKIKIFSVLTLLVISNTFAQTDCSDLELKNEKLNSELAQKKQLISLQVNDIKKLNSEIQYYKESLNLLNTKNQKESNNIIYRINSVKGKYDNGTIIVEGSIENKGFPTKFVAQSIDIFDPKGNKYKASKFQIGNSKLLFVGKLERNLPTKFIFEFKGISEEIPVLKALIFNHYEHTKMSSVTFNNLSVNWE
ncbi:hypothetical protein [Polaribacter sargassicola]|uniref:hypothetical protein n=1 Tax=Polaribacter sargassicola TaxID=2836891 RepID=UPI001F178EC6|nr:hypothetical protein [Polaribacter sp. DS7-9]MCG1035921.1 hypothetical protein [Polaribacter sp. DS7-9]